MSESRQQIIDSIADTIAQLKRSYQSYWQDHYAELGLHPSQLNILRCIQQAQPVTSKEIARQMHLTPGAVSQMLDGLRKSDCIFSNADKTDRRLVHISISPHGQEILTRFAVLQREVLVAALHTVDTADLQTFLRVQQSMTEWLDTNQK